MKMISAVMLLFCSLVANASEFYYFKVNSDGTLRGSFISSTEETSRGDRILISVSQAEYEAGFEALDPQKVTDAINAPTSSKPLEMDYIVLHSVSNDLGIGVAATDDKDIVTYIAHMCDFTNSVAQSNLNAEVSAHNAAKNELGLTPTQVTFLKANLLNLTDAEIKTRFPVNGTDAQKTEACMAFILRYLAKKEIKEVRQ